MERYRGSLAELVMARRGLLGLSQTELARKAGLSKMAVNQIERGKNQWPGPEVRRALARALNTAHAELVVAAGQLTPEEIVEGAALYDPGRAAAAAPFPEGTPAAELVEAIKEMGGEEVALVLGNARVVRDLYRRRRGALGGPEPVPGGASRVAS